MKQTQKILDYIDRFGSITPLDAMRDLGVMRLAARIQDLERQGIAITSTLESGVNRLGEKTHYARYSRTV